MDLGTDPSPEKLAWYLKKHVDPIVDVRKGSSNLLRVGRRSDDGYNLDTSHDYDDIEAVIVDTIWEQRGHELHKSGWHGRSEIVPETTTYTILVR